MSSMELSKSEPEIEELGLFLSKLNKESDRGAVLISGTMLDAGGKEINSLIKEGFRSLVEELF